MNRIFYIFLISVLTPLSVFSQQNYCLTDLEALYEILKETPGYQDQIFQKNEKEYIELLNLQKEQAKEATRDSQCFLLLSGLVAAIKDNHLSLSQIPDVEITADQLKDSAFMDAYRAREDFINFSSVRANFDSLERALATVPEYDFQGIYYYKDYIKAGFFKIGEGNRYIGVVLESRLPNWKQGHIAFLGKEYDGGFWNIWNYDLLNKNLTLYSGERIVNHTFKRLPWSKFPTRIDYSLIPESSELFQLRSLSPTIQYLRLGTFASSNQALERSQVFYDQIKDSLSAPNLILDLRNNGGGGSKASRKYYQLIREKSKTAKIWLLFNQKTASNAEQIALELIKLDNISTLGVNTIGILAYGNNYGESKILPSGKFKIYITDMKDSGNYLQYESVGIKPDHFLMFDEDWLDQTIAIIESSGN
jgi:hypothetical protein